MARRARTTLLLLYLALSSCHREEPVQGRGGVVVLAPALGEICQRLGVPVAGRTLYGHGDGEVVGDLLSPSVERIAALRPSLVLAMDFQDRVVRKLRAMGIRVHTFTLDSFEDIASAVRTIGAMTHTGARAEEIISSMWNELRSMRCATPRRVLIVVGREPGGLGRMVGASASTFLGEAVRLAGATPVLDGPAPYPSLSLEMVRSLEFDAVVDTTPWNDDPWHGELNLPQHVMVIRLKERRWTVPSPSAVRLVRLLNRRLCGS